MVRSEIGDHPAHGHIAPREHLRNVEKRDEGQLHAAPDLRLQVTQHSGAVQGVHYRGGELAGLLALRRLLAQERNQLARAAHGFFVAYVGKACDRLRHVHASISVHFSALVRQAPILVHNPLRENCGGLRAALTPAAARLQ